MPTRFGWYGLGFDHPDEWAPVAINGDRRSGYARLASPRDLSFQIRWETCRNPDPEGAMRRYLGLLARDMRRRKVDFTHQISGDCYRYCGGIGGEGTVRKTADGRVVFLEAVGKASSARHRAIELAIRSFSAEGRERWSTFGIDFDLPQALGVRRKEFLSGKTSLTLARRGVCVEAERWGLADELLKGRTLSDWVQRRFAHRWSHEKSSAEAKWELSRENVWGFDQLLAEYRPTENLIRILRVRSRDELWRPRWDWFN